MQTAIHIRGVSAGDEDIERVREARRKLGQVKQNLMSPSPELLGECGPVLGEAAELLGSLLESGKSHARVPVRRDQLRIELRTELRIELRIDLRAELQQLRKELTLVAALMDQAAHYYLGWAQMLGAAVCGYTSHGDIPPLTVESRLSLEG